MAREANKNAPGMKVVSFSLWGSAPKYVTGAMRNAELLPVVYPGWIGRFYCGSSVPAEALRRLEAMPQVEVVRMAPPGDWRGMFWRFCPATEPEVAVMVSRDTDSRLGAREKAAVDAWLASDRDFHTMRDHPWHNTPILGGMWGVRNGLLADLRQQIDAFETGDFWQVDQHFLNNIIAPRVCERWLEHDEYFARKPFPTRRRGREYVGQPFDENDRPLLRGPYPLEWRLRRLACRFRDKVLRR
jgi:hypothetical protein